MTVKRANGSSYHGPGVDHAVPDLRARTFTNALTVDVEDYFHVYAFAARISQQDWDGWPSRVEANTDTLLELFDAAGVCATFFVLGWVAERHPETIRAIGAGGHEVASHGYFHTNVGSQSPASFRSDVRDSKKLLEDIVGQPVRGYRAANFSMGARTSWAFGILEEEGYAYSSSVYPIHHDHYGEPWAPRAPFTPQGTEELLEIPLTTMRLFGVNMPCGGGGYFRLWPYPVSSWALRRVNRIEQRPFVFYLHPWEIDPGQPRVPGVKLSSRLRHYMNLSMVNERLRRLLEEFRWNRVDEVFLGDAAERAMPRSCPESASRP